MCMLNDSHSQSCVFDLMLYTCITITPQNVAINVSQWTLYTTQQSESECALNVHVITRKQSNNLMAIYLPNGRDTMYTTFCHVTAESVSKNH